MKVVAPIARQPGEPEHSPGSAGPGKLSAHGHAQDTSFAQMFHGSLCNSQGRRPSPACASTTTVACASVTSTEQSTRSGGAPDSGSDASEHDASVPSLPLAALSTRAGASRSASSSAAHLPGRVASGANGAKTAAVTSYRPAGTQMLTGSAPAAVQTGSHEPAPRPGLRETGQAHASRTAEEPGKRASQESGQVLDDSGPAAGSASLLPVAAEHASGRTGGHARHAEWENPCDGRPVEDTISSVTTTADRAGAPLSPWDAHASAAPLAADILRGRPAPSDPSRDSSSARLASRMDARMAARQTAGPSRSIPKSIASSPQSEATSADGHSGPRAAGNPIGVSTSANDGTRPAEGSAKLSMAPAATPDTAQPRLPQGTEPAGTIDCQQAARIPVMPTTTSSWGHGAAVTTVPVRSDAEPTATIDARQAARIPVMPTTTSSWGHGASGTTMRARSDAEPTATIDARQAARIPVMPATTGSWGHGAPATPAAAPPQAQPTASTVGRQPAHSSSSDTNQTSVRGGPARDASEPAADPPPAAGASAVSTAASPPIPPTSAAPAAPPSDSSAKRHAPAAQATATLSQPAAHPAEPVSPPPAPAASGTGPDVTPGTNYSQAPAAATSDPRAPAHGSSKATRVQGRRRAQDETDASNAEPPPAPVAFVANPGTTVPSAHPQHAADKVSVSESGPRVGESPSDRPAAHAPLQASHEPGPDGPRAEPVLKATQPQPQPPAPTQGQAQVPLITHAPGASAPNNSAPVGLHAAPHLPAHAVPLAAQAMRDDGLSMTVMPHAAHMAIESPEGDLALHLRVREGKAEITVGGSMAPLFEARAPEARAALAGEGLALGRFDLGQQGNGQQGQPAPEAPERVPDPPAPYRQQASDPAPTPSDGRIHVTA